MQYFCHTCGYVYDEAASGTLWKDLPSGWTCPVCRSSFSSFYPFDGVDATEFDGEDVSYEDQMEEEYQD